MSINSSGRTLSTHAVYTSFKPPKSEHAGYVKNRSRQLCATSRKLQVRPEVKVCKDHGYDVNHDNLDDSRETGEG